MVRAANWCRKYDTNVCEPGRAQSVPCPTMELRPLMTIDVLVQPLVDLAAFPLGGRRVVVFDGGSFHGRDGLRGTIAAGGGDWQLARGDGVIEIDAHYLLLGDDGEPIEVRSTGLRKASAAVAERNGRGEPVDPSEYYFRTHVRLSTSSARLAWMNDLLAVSTGERRRDTVRIEVHEIA
jgi:hypothetical protein